jgi:hypothetical protein
MELFWKLRDSGWVIYGSPLLIIASSVVIAMSPLIVVHPEMATAITIDLTISAPLIYFLLILKKPISKLSVLAFQAIGIMLASLLLPADNQWLLTIMKYWVFPALELFVVAFLGYWTYRAVKIYRSTSADQTDVYKIIREVCQSVFKSRLLAAIFASEIALAYYAFFLWRKPEVRGYTYHRKSGRISLYLVMMLIISVETIAVHLLAAQWSEVLAWILTISSGYLLLLLFGHLKAITHRPIEVTENKIIFRYGLAGDAEIEIDNVAEIQGFTAVPAADRGIVKVGLLGDLESHNIKLTLKQTQSMKRFYNLNLDFSELVFFVDESDKFLDEIARLQKF